MEPLAYFIWDPSPALFHFNLPLLGRPLLWYGVLFAAGVCAGYMVLLRMVRRIVSAPAQAKLLAERLSFYVIVGAVIGARLGDVLFYQDWNFLIHHPLSIFALWEGGLASHGGAAGILIALWLFSRRHRLAFWTALDLVVVPVALAAPFIRVGNFINQEILGTATTLPWGVVFLHPVDGGAITARHPVQLYEALFYFAVFCILFWLWRRRPSLQPPGTISALFLILVFGFRFFVEFVKVEQSVFIHGAHLFTMGQWLSLPLLALGVGRLIFLRKNKKA